MSGSRRQLLVVEDEEDIRNLVRYNLEQEGFEPLEAADGEQALALARKRQPHLVILDLMLPGMNGLEVCRVLRADERTAKLPVLMLTARATEVDKVLGLEMGADDYVTKPFSPRELVARVRALLRRAGRPVPSDPGVAIRLGTLTIDPASRRVTSSGDAVHLTPTEFDLLYRLAEAPHVVFGRRRLLEEVWGYQIGAGERTVDSHVRAIRRKLGHSIIRTVHGIGYALDTNCLL
jgi:DNA-binding response OmpR family regulator